MPSLRSSSSFPTPPQTALSLRASASDLSYHDPNKQGPSLNWNKFSQVVMVNEHKDPDDDGKADSNKKRILFWKRNRKRNSSSNNLASNPSCSILVLSTRKQHKQQALGITLRQETSNSGGKSPGVYLTGIGPHSPFFRAASRYLPQGSKIVLVNGQPCPASVKEVANRLLQVPQGAVLTLHFEVNTSSNNKSTSKLPSLFRRSNSNTTMLNPIQDKHYAPDHPFHQNKERLRSGKQLPRSILKTPKYSSNSLSSMGCSGGPSPMQMLALHYRTAKILHDEAVLEFEQLGKFLTQSWSTSGSSSSKALTDTSASLIEKTNSRWASIRADELAEF
ncbi:unnamed protein product [Cylindrotheca closterium]|uniref:PDZ domain-containing protein n=1 Tax=Cylindrotheca closterium TaxID=2856 RepID=A0AAD2CJ35_9STRA|nr:unnamed protein product [Cylindrotheca closterium]